MEEIRSCSAEIKSLAAVHRSWGFPTDGELLWLLDQEVDEKALWPVSGATVRFNGISFDIDPDGERALIFRAEDRGRIIDLVAWVPQTNKLASWTGRAFCLGDADDIFNPATFFCEGGLHVHPTVLQWLQAKRTGIVIVRPELAHVYISNCRRIVCSDATYARRLERCLQPPQPTAEILIAIEERAAA